MHMAGLQVIFVGGLWGCQAASSLALSINPTAYNLIQHKFVQQTAARCQSALHQAVPPMLRSPTPAQGTSASCPLSPRIHQS